MDEETKTSNFKPKSDFIHYLSNLLPTFVVIDVETTGLNEKNCEIIELGAALFKSCRFVDKFSQLIKPQIKHIPVEITKLTGITDRDLSNSPSINEAIKEFIDFIGENPLIGHNIEFDLAFLSEIPSIKSSLNRNRIIPRIHDTNLIARFLHPCLDSYSLRHLTSIHKTPTRPSHRAADDAIATGELFVELTLKLMLVSKKDLHTAYNLVEGTSSPLANTLRLMLKSDSPDNLVDLCPDPLWNSKAGRNNVYQSPGQSTSKGISSPDNIHHIFTNKDRLKRIIPNYELRKEQIEMAEEVATVLTNEKILLAEAGTGVGKSIGYLIPSILSGEQTVISTYTKNLQDQLFFDEIPRLGNLFDFRFNAVLLKGRKNYLCYNKWNNLLSNPGRLTPKLLEKTALITRWVNSTVSGDISELTSTLGSDDYHSDIYSLIASDPGYCSARSCNSGGLECPFSRIRRLARNARLLIVNHSLVAAELSNEENLLDNFHYLIIDEAHHLENAVTDCYSTDVHPLLLKTLLERLFRMCKRNGELWTLFSLQSKNDESVVLCERIASEASLIMDNVDNFFTSIRLLLPLSKTDALYPQSYKYRSNDTLCSALNSFGSSLREKIKTLAEDSGRILRILSSDNSLPNLPAISPESYATIQMLLEVIDSLGLSLDANDINRVYWIEVPVENNTPVHLKTAPLDLKEILSENLFTRFKSIVLTSATLTTGRANDAFRYLIERLGLNLLPGEKLLTAQFGSPFDYTRNCIICIPTYLSSPVENTAEHNHQTAELISTLSIKLRRSILVLFTSYQSLRSVEKILKKLLSGHNIELLSQRGRMDRDRLIRQFRQSKGGILLGTDSFWEGIDLPGSTLEIVVITKLPFDVPADPVISARIQEIREHGSNPFNEYQLPMAVLRTKQGAGRLIRTLTDRGSIVILDPRINTKSYGRTILSALNGRVVMPVNMEETNSVMSEFFEYQVN